MMLNLRLVSKIKLISTVWFEDMEDLKKLLYAIFKEILEVRKSMKNMVDLIFIITESAFHQSFFIYIYIFFK